MGVEHETPKKAATEVSEDPRQTALDLIELALGDGTTEEEGRSAAVKAVKFIDKHDLLTPDSRNEAVRAVGSVVDTITDPDFVDRVKTITSVFTRRGGDSADGGGRRRRRRRR